MFSAFGATAAAAKILELDARQIVDAFSLTLCQTTCSGEIKYSAESHLRAVRDGFAAQAGVLAAELARRGVRGFEAPFEGKAGFFALYAASDYDADVLTGDLGRRFLGEDVSFKFWPSCRGTHAFIEAALAMRAEGVRAQDIAHIDMAGIAMLTMLIEPTAQKRAPATAIDAKFSLPFTVATAFEKGAVTLDSFSPEARADRAVLALAGRTSFAARADWGPERTASGVLSVALRDGRVRTREIAHAFGHPNNPMSREALIEKFHQCADRAAHPWPQARRARVIASVFALERAADAARALLAPPGGV
jgi:2-methylcitrate dehydratase PrpD